MMGTKINMGPSAVLKNDQLTLLLTSNKTPPMDLGQLTSQGINPRDAKLIIIKAACLIKMLMSNCFSEFLY